MIAADKVLSPHPQLGSYSVDQLKSRQPDLSLLLAPPESAYSSIRHRSEAGLHIPQVVAGANLQLNRFPQGNLTHELTTSAFTIASRLKKPPMDHP
ncbi:unnamed protein product [Protopolystoma xenopodis]|uniref:Uncharacterized protein n=1 Tax=Protopolystoma xenopodis TaxID=117903 RepID=A0A448XA75_9PLAT|nr:unnamed protein product [Protopolystoma xenopodis]